MIEPIAEALRGFALGPLRAAAASSETELLLLDDTGLAHAVQDLAGRARLGERARVALRSVAGAAVEITALPLGGRA